MMRASRIKLLRHIARCHVRGYWTRGQTSVFLWLLEHGLIVRVPEKSLSGYCITDAGRAALARLGYCDRCGGHGPDDMRNLLAGGSVQAPDGLGIKWVSCIHPRREER